MTIGNRFWRGALGLLFLISLCEGEANSTTHEPTPASTKPHTTEPPKPITTEPTTTTTKEPLADQCESDIFPCSDKIVGNLVLICFYGLTLGVAAKLISDGAESLLDLNFPPAIVGGVVLPVMGAVPDSVMIFVSGLGDPATAQNQISVGMGTLAGSTILLLTIAWGVSIIVGRTDIEEHRDGSKTCKEGSDGCSEGFKLMLHGVEVSKDVMLVAGGMCLTVVSYFIVQASDFYFGPTKVKVAQPHYVKYAALVTMIICFIGFIGYLAFQVFLSLKGENPRIEVHMKRRQYAMARAAHTFLMNTADRPDENTETIRSAPHPDTKARSAAKLWRMRTRAAASLGDAGEGSNINVSIEVPTVEFSSDTQTLIESGEGEEEPKWKIAVGAFSRLFGGVAMVTFFSDPMCDALTALTDENNPSYIPIGAFYVSFVVTPLCSNASELVSSILLAMQKEKDKLNMTFSQIYGACIMNNTLCLGVFCALIFFRDLEWYFSAEVTVIVLFELVMGGVALFYKTVYPLYLSVVVICFYPISLAMVALMENVLHWG